MNSFDADITEAITKREEGDLEGSLRILERLACSEGATTAVFALLGHVLWELGRVPEAVSHFRTATEISPRNETVSLGLFHTLMQSDKVEEAFNEIRRFLSISDSAEYRTLLRELNEAD